MKDKMMKSQKAIAMALMKKHMKMTMDEAMKRAMKIMKRGMK